MKKNSNRRKFNLIKTYGSYIFVLYAIMLSVGVYGQENTKQDTAKVQLNYNKPGDGFSFDTGYIQKQALDIGSDRGLFIVSSDKKMQMRILGSVRADFSYTDQDLDNENSLEPYDIPTNISTLSPNYYASLSQTRLGFEVTRKTKSQGDVFIRIEGDFASNTNSFRIRQAYGQFKNILLGQTWSLFSNVNYQPATVSFDGVTGSISLRTPQIRFFGDIGSKFKWAAAIEYSLPDFYIPDSLDISLLQVIPDFTGKIEFKSGIFTGSLVGLITTISGRDTTDEISYGFGTAGSFSGSFDIDKKNKIFFSFTAGQGMNHFIGVFSGNREDAYYNPSDGKFEFLPSISGFAGYSREINKSFSANISAGFASILNKEFQDPYEYSSGYNVLLNIFLTPVEGAKVGFQYGYGQRFDKGGDRGMANQIAMLMYYDF